ncbi:MAG: FG-GAP repeat protein [Candidatus Brocadia sp.]
MICLKQLRELFPLTWCEITILAVGIITFNFPAYGKIRGDFNGDGFSDLAIGVPFEDITVRTRTITDAGAVNVLYGSSRGLQATSPDDQFWHQNSPDVRNVSEAEDCFGWALSTGDFNGDGYDDLAIGVPLEDITIGTVTITNAGAVNVLYGSSRGLQATSPDDQFWHQSRADVQNVSETEDRFGWVLSTGDFNGDGYDDLAIGIPFEDGAGAVQVLYGSSRGLQATTPDDQFWHQDSPGVKETKEIQDNFGRYLSAGDFNGDGYDDLAIGVPDEDVTIGTTTAINAGTVQVLYGSLNGLQANGVGGPDDQLWQQGHSGVQDTPEGGDYFGSNLSVGDFDGDGYDDLAIGVYREEIIAGTNNAGAVQVLYGSLNGLQADGVNGPDDQLWQQGGDVLDKAEEKDNFGLPLASGDFNNDGYDDLAIGVPDEDLAEDEIDHLNNNDEGAIAVLYGSPDGLQADGVNGPDDQFWHQNSPGVRNFSETKDYFGSSLGAGDFNGDGSDDLAIGIFKEDVGAGRLFDAGAVAVLYGSSTAGLQASAPDDQLWSQNSPGVRDTAEDVDNFGMALPETHEDGNLPQ